MGYVDTIDVPVSLPTASTSSSGSQQQQSSQSGKKGKGKASAQGDDAPFDVAQSWTAEERDNVERCVQMAMFLGYDTVLLNVSIPPTFNPARLVLRTPLIPSIDPRTASSTSTGSASGSKGRILQMWKLTVGPYDEATVKGTGQRSAYGFSNATASLFPKGVVLGIAPNSLGALSHTALSLAPPSAFSPSLLVLDAAKSPKPPFPLKRGLVGQLTRAGMRVEISYRAMLSAGDFAPRGNSTNSSGGESGLYSDNVGERRRFWIGHAREIVRIAGAENVVLCSGARKPAEMRAPVDMANLCALLGLTMHQANKTMSEAPQHVIVRTVSLKQTFKGAVSDPHVVPRDDSYFHAAPAAAATTSGSKTGASKKAMNLLPTAATPSVAASASVQANGKSSAKRKRDTDGLEGGSDDESAAADEDMSLDTTSSPQKSGTPATISTTAAVQHDGTGGGQNKKKRKKKRKDGAESGGM